VATGQMQFPLTLFWYSLILVHRVILYQTVLQLGILFLYVKMHHGDQYRKLGSQH